MAWNFSGQTHGNAAGTVHQNERQTGWQLSWLFGGTIVVRNKVNCPLVNFIQQQSGDFGETRFCITHGRSTIAITAAKVALTINQRIALAEVLRHAHQCVVGRLVAMGVKPAQHIAHHTGTFNRLGTGGTREAQAHAGHGIQDASLNRFLAIAHIWQCATFDHAECVFKVSALRIGGQIQRVIGLAVFEV